MYKFITLILLSLCCSIGSAQQVEFAWALGISASNSIGSSKFVADDAGNLYLVGFLVGEADMDPGPGVYPLTAGTTVSTGLNFVAKYDVQGNFLFAFLVDVSLTDIALDATGQVVVAGTLTGSADLDPGPEEHVLTSVGGSDVLVAVYTPQGAFVHAYSFGGSGQDRVDECAVTSEGNYMLLGTFEELMDLDPGPGVAELVSDSGSPTLFWAQFSSSGTFQNAFSVTSCSATTDLLAAPDGTFYLSGRFLDPVDVDPSDAEVIFTTQGGVDHFWAQYAADGTYLTGASNDGNIESLAVNAADELFISGRIQDSLDVDLGPGETWVLPLVGYDMFLVKYNAARDLVYVKVFGCMEIAAQYGLAADDAGNAFLVGRFPATVDFDEGQLGGELTPAGSYDGFLSAFGPDGQLLLAHPFGGASSDNLSDVETGTAGEVWIVGSHTGIALPDPADPTVQINSGTTPGFFLVKYELTTNTSVANPDPVVPWNITSGNGSLSIDLTTTLPPVERIDVHDAAGRLLASVQHPSHTRIVLPLPNRTEWVVVVTVHTNRTTYSKKAFVR